MPQPVAPHVVPTKVSSQPLTSPSGTSAVVPSVSASSPSARRPRRRSRRPRPRPRPHPGRSCSRRRRRPLACPRLLSEPHAAIAISERTARAAIVVRIGWLEKVIYVPRDRAKRSPHGKTREARHSCSYTEPAPISTGAACSSAVLLRVRPHSACVKAAHALLSGKPCLTSRIGLALRPHSLLRRSGAQAEGPNEAGHVPDRRISTKGPPCGRRRAFCFPPGRLTRCARTLS